MAGGQEREIPRSITPQQGSRPDQKHSLEAGEGTRGISKPAQGKPQQDKGEGQPLPNVQNILERRAQLYESRIRDLYQRQHKSKHSREYLALYDEHRNKVRQLGDEVASHYAEWTGHDRLIFDLYTTREFEEGSSQSTLNLSVSRPSGIGSDDCTRKLPISV